MEWFHLGVLSQTSRRVFSVPGRRPSKTLPVLHDARFPLPINVDAALDARTAKTRMIDEFSIRNSILQNWKLEIFFYIFFPQVAQTY